MWTTIQNIFSPSEYMPHGNCFLWQTPLIWLHVLSDAFIGIAYFSIPVMLIYFVCKRRNTRFSKVFILFGAFIITCGAGHLLDILTLWYPLYWLSGIEKAFTALISCYTAFELMNLLPIFLALKTPEELEKINQQLEQEIIERQEKESTLKTILAGTGSMTGGEFFPALVTNLAKTLNVKYVFASEIIGEENSILSTLAFCEEEKILDNFEYDLVDSPCKEVVENRIPACHTSHVTSFFPNNKNLQSLKAVSYLGLPLLNNMREVIGTLCVIDTKPLINYEKSLAIMQLFASRASAEIQRQRATENLSLAYTQLEDKVEERTSKLKLTLAELEEEIEKRKEIEKALKLEQMQLEKIINKAPVAIAMVDKNMLYIAHSEKWRTDYNLPNDNLIGHSFYETFPNLPQKWLDLHQRALQGESLSQNEDIVEYNNHTFYLSWAFQPWYISEEEIGGLIIVTQNIEEIVKAKQIALETSEIKSHFLANMSHEIRTPMSGILGIVEILKRTDLSEQQQQYVDTLNYSSRHLLFVINDILDFSKLEANEMQLEQLEFSVYNCLESVLSVLFNQAEKKKLELLTFVEKNVPSLVIGDINRLRQILLNLVGNSLKFTEEGYILINILLDSQTDDQVKLKFEVIDTGVGISQKNQNELFNSFTQVDTSTTRKYGGTGLGLAICKRLAELMGGEIGVKSELNQGATFWFTANFTKCNQENSLINLAQEKLINQNILIIDSSITKSQILIKQLESWGMKCTNYSSCLDAVLNIQKESVQDLSFNFVLVNWEGKRRENDKLIYQIIVTHPQLNQAKNILIISPEKSHHQLAWLKENKINYLIKPLHISQLIESMLATLIPQPENVLSGANNSLITVKLESENLPNNQLKILLVEDTFINQTVITTLLKTLGYQSIDCADNGQIALDKLEKEHYDLIFMDCLMPVLDGYETTKKIREKEKEKNEKPIIIVAMTANAFAGEREKCLQTGMNDYIAKPIEIGNLTNILFRYQNEINKINNSTHDLTNNSSNITYDNLIDLEKLKQIYGDDLNTINEALMMYIDDAQFYLEDLKQAYKDKNIERICYFVAEFLGISESIAINLIPDYLSEIENLAKEYSWEKIFLLINKLEIALEILESGLIHS